MPRAAFLLLIVLKFASFSAAPLEFMGSIIQGEGGVDGLEGANDIAISPDGRNVYVTAHFDRSIATFSRDTSSGSLKYISYIPNVALAKYNLSAASCVAVSFDGRNVCVGSGIAINSFNRDLTNGSLTFKSAIFDTTRGVDGLNWPGAIAFSNDGKNVYAVSYGDDALTTLNCDSSGNLTYVSCLKDNLNNVDGLDGANDLFVSPDGKNIYVTAGNDSALSVFSRNLSTGELTFSTIFKNGVNGIDCLKNAMALAMSPDGNNLYVMSKDPFISIFNRNQSDGSLFFAGKVIVNVASPISYNCGFAISPDGKSVYAGEDRNGVVHLFARASSTGTLAYVKTITITYGLGSSPHSFAISGDGRNMYVTPLFHMDNDLGILSRNTSSGELSFSDTLVDEAGSPGGLLGAAYVTMSPDEKFIYVASPSDSSIGIFSRDTSTGIPAFVSRVKRPNLGGVNWISISSDGANAYATATSSVLGFARNTANGNLSYQTCWNNDSIKTTCLTGVRSLAMRPDGKIVYTAASGDGAIGIFSRNQITGLLSFSASYKNGQDGIDGLNSAASLCLSPDGNNIYVASGGSSYGGYGALAQFRCDTISETLTYISCMKDAAYGTSTSVDYGLGGANCCKVSPDGKYVYITAYSDSAVSIFARNEITGALQYKSSFRGSGYSDIFEAPRQLAVSPDGQYVFMVASGRGVLCMLRHDKVADTLKYFTRLSASDLGTRGLNSANSLCLSKDGAFAYVTASWDNALSFFKINYNTGLINEKQRTQHVANFEIKTRINCRGFEISLPATTLNSNYEISIYDPLGRNLHKHILPGAAGMVNKYRINLNTLRRGCYVLTVENAGRSFVKPFVIM
jgi:6-phosphogluconolactonase (cycloisomerase 2 family)